MHLFQHIYCRLFQTAFKLAFPVLPYRDPEILDHVRQIPTHLLKKDIHSVLIVTDGFLHVSGALEPMKKTLSEAHIHYTVYDETVPNPTVWNVESAREQYIKNGCQALIGFGGGSAIDCAKAVGARIARPSLTVSKMQGILKVRKQTPHLIAIPTTAGTGSEVTPTTVITDHKTHRKSPVSDFPLIPRAAVLDPENTRSLPPHLTATTGMDALTHAIEAYIGRSTTRSTRADALAAAALIAASIEQAYVQGDDMRARKAMLTAAFRAGRAFSRSYVGYCHAVAHSLGGKYSIPHGLANAVLLPYVLESYGSAIYNSGKDLAIAIGVATHSTPADRATQALIARIRQLNAHMGIPTKLAGIRPADIPQLAQAAAREANPLYPVPRLMDAKALETFYYDVMEEPK